MVRTPLSTCGLCGLLAVLANGISDTTYNCGADHGSSRVLFDNERLRIIDYRLAPGAQANLTNTVPTVRWQIKGADEDIPMPTFHAAGTCTPMSHSAGGTAEHRFFVFEVKGPPKYGEERVRELLRAPNYTSAVGSRMFLENDLVRMWDFHSPVGMDEFHQHVLDYAFVVIGNHSALNLFHPNASLPNGTQYDATFGFMDGHVSWEAVDNGGFEPDGKLPIMPGCLHSVDTRGISHEFREYLIELK